MSPDFLELLSALVAAEARFLVVGGYAVGFHARPRATKDLDVWFDRASDNTPRVLAALPRSVRRLPRCPPTTWRPRTSSS